MTTIPGVSISTEVVNQNPRGNSDALICLIGACQQASAIASPLLFTTYNQAVAALGSVTTNGRLIEMIYQVFNNGAKQVLAVVTATTGANTITEYQAALDSIRTYDGIDAVVVEDTSSAIQTALETHCDSAALGFRFRRAYVGLPSGSVIADYVTRAAVFANPRVFVVGPNMKNAAGDEVEGGVIAAAAAIVAEKGADPSLPVTGLPINGFSGLFLQVLDADYDTLHNGGVYTVTDRGSNSVMRYLTSEISGDTAIKEGTISKTRDYIMDALKTKLENEFRRAKLTNSVIKQIEGSVKAKLSEFQGQTIISPDNAISVLAEQDATDKTKVNVTASYYAVYPVNFISVTMTLNL